MAAQITATAICAVDATPKMEKLEIKRRGCLPNDVHIEVSYSGICHSDIHTVKGEWGPQIYPICSGHEILGKVAAVGDAVTKFKVGDIAGVGCFVDSCGDCDACKEGDEQYCIGPQGMTGTYGSKNRPEELYPGGQTQGGYSSDIVVNENYALKVPENLNVAGGAPLLCAGITCFSPFQHYGLKAGMKLGVFGLGGLGHMAVKIANAMGAEVTVFSRTEGKREMAMGFGAKHFIISADEEAMKGAAKSLDMIYDSICFVHDISAELNLLRSSGTCILVGGIPDKMNVSSFQLIARRLKLVGSMIGGIKETQQMLDFCGEHNILSEVELIPADPAEVEKAYERAIAGDVKFRFVIDTAATMKA